jgi:phosphohistidine phosphatase SixA
MKRLLLRHAAAVPRGTAGVSDDERPLTPSGWAAFRVGARGPARIARRPDVVLTSPLARARATAENLGGGNAKKIDVTIVDNEGGVAGALVWRS